MVDLPSDWQAIMSKWGYCIKHNHNGMITKHKARLMAKGCSQIPRIDFVETFTLVMQLETFWLLIALATKLELVIHMVNVVGTYLNGTLDEVIFMMQPLEELNQTFLKMDFT